MKKKQPTPAKDFLTKIYKKFGYLTRKSIGQRAHSASFLLKYEKVQLWVTAWPNASEENYKNWLKNNADMIREMLSPNHDQKAIQELNQLTQQ
jgi:hypothetical protein